MLIRPVTVEVKKMLEGRVKEMAVKRGQKKTTYEVAEWWLEVIDDDGQPAISTYQGWWKKVTQALRAKGRVVSLVDQTVDLPPPNLRAALEDLRPYQKTWFLEFILKGSSGLIGGPTRWGKTWGMSSVCKAWPTLGGLTVITAPGEDLCRQIYEHMIQVFPQGAPHNKKPGYREVRGIWMGSPHREPGGDIIVVSVDSLHRVHADSVMLLLADEPQSLVSKKRITKISQISNARKYGFSATLKGRYDARDPLIEGLFGPVLSNRTYLEGVECGAIVPLVVCVVPIRIPAYEFPPRCGSDEAWHIIQCGRSITKFVKTLSERIIPNDWQVMWFIENEKQAEHFLEKSMPEEGTVAMAKRLPSKKKRKEFTDLIADGTYKRVLASKIYNQGLTFPDLKIVGNLSGGGANTSAIQRPGRLLQPREGKNYGVYIEFQPKIENSDAGEEAPWKLWEILAQKRIDTYLETGYDVRFMHSMDHLKQVILESNT